MCTKTDNAQLIFEILEKAWNARSWSSWYGKFVYEVLSNYYLNRFTSFLIHFYRLAAVRENTVHSLNSAAKNGADYVEFDVQLTKDKVLFFFHSYLMLKMFCFRFPLSITIFMYAYRLQNAVHRI